MEVVVGVAQDRLDLGDVGARAHLAHHPAGLELGARGRVSVWWFQNPLWRASALKCPIGAAVLSLSPRVARKGGAWQLNQIS